MDKQRPSTRRLGIFSFDVKDLYFTNRLPGITGLVLETKVHCIPLTTDGKKRMLLWTGQRPDDVAHIYAPLLSCGRLWKMYERDATPTTRSKSLVSCLSSRPIYSVSNQPDIYSSHSLGSTHHVFAVDRRVRLCIHCMPRAMTRKPEAICLCSLGRFMILIGATAMTWVQNMRIGLLSFCHRNCLLVIGC